MTARLGRILDHISPPKMLKNCSRLGSSVCTSNRPFTIDHFVSQCANDEVLEKSLEFYVSVFGLETDRLEEYRKGEVPFPSLRLSPESLIDLFPGWKFGLTDTPGSRVNHICLATDGQRMLDILDELHKRSTPIERVLEVAYGAQGTAFSVYVLDPNEVQIEIRTYDARYWRRVKAKTESMMK